MEKPINQYQNQQNIPISQNQQNYSQNQRYLQMYNQNNQYYNIHLEDNPDTINNLINSNYSKNNPNFLKINTKKPLYDKNIEFFGTIQRENLEEGLNMQELSNVQKRYQDLANELYNIRFKNIGSSLFTELNDLVYDKSQYFDTSFSFMDKKLIQKAKNKNI